MDCERLCCALKDLSSRVQDLASSPSNFVLHRSQCCCLARSYALVVDHVTQQLHHTLSLCNDRSFALKNLLPCISELHHSMLQGHKFMQDCSFQNGWVSKAVILALTSDAQDVCLHDLVWCLCVIRQATCQVALSVIISESYDEVFSSLNAIWAETSQMDDSVQLIKALKQNIAQWEHQLSHSVLPTDSFEELTAQCDLARFLLKKMVKESIFHDVGTSNNTPSNYTLLWEDPTQFTIKESIGHGSYAVVYEVEWCGQSYGQKEFFGVDERIFGKEAAIQARLRHPNVLQLICCTSKPSRQKCSLVTELMDMDLRSAIDNRCNKGFDPPFPILTAVDLMLQIAKGMEYLHGLNIMHRDLKSQNMLVSRHVSGHDAQDDSRMRLKIADFGMSKAKYTSSKFSTLHAGTTLWRAPEVFKVDGKGELHRKYTKKADVYSFAMVCYEILTGKVPFDDGGKLKELHKRLLRGERPILPTSCPQYLASYIERCWHANPVKRPSFAQISRTLRHLKGILLTSVNPFFSSALTGPSCSNIEDELEQIMGVDWVTTASVGVTTKSLTITFEMLWYKVMESKLMEQKGAPTKIEQTDCCRADFMSKFVCCSRWIDFGRCLGRGQHTSKLETVPKQAESDESWQLSLRRFTFKELYEASNHFGNRIGRGGTGIVYKATLADGEVVAVKFFSDMTREVYGKEFTTELEFLGRVRHRNLVPLLGFCAEGDRLLLVYKFMPGGDLWNLMQQGITFTWAQKYNIVRGLASALNFLHNGCSPPVVHRDVKPSNILLDDNQEACLADFGIARRISDTAETHVTTQLKGTPGYMAPEYFATLKLGYEADVYAFGLVVLELVCGRRVIEHDAESHHIVEYVWMQHQQKRLLNAVCGNEGGEGHDCEKEEVIRLLHLGLACTQFNPKERPSMSTVVDIVSKKAEAPIPVNPPYHMHG